MRNSTKKRALISTLYTQGHGGVYTKLAFLVSVLKNLNYDIKIAYYMPYSMKPELSASLKNPLKCPTSFHFIGELGVEEYAIGAWFPELEVLNYYPTQTWKELIAEADLCFVVSGHILSALPFYITKKKYVAWIGTAYTGDRENRIKTFPWYRKLFDHLIISRVNRWLEKKLLKAGTVFSISRYTQRELGNAIVGVMPAPVNTALFLPKRECVQPGLICFTGRFLDPRKNVLLLLDAFAAVCKKIPNAQLCMIGDEKSDALEKKLDMLNIASRVMLLKYVSQAEMIEKLQQADVFVIPSYQEGFCISGLEAMACACPVVSTRCGGPTDYVIDGKNGYLVDFDARELAEKIITIVADRDLRMRLSVGALEMVEKNYSEASVKEKLISVIESGCE